MRAKYTARFFLLLFFWCVRRGGLTAIISPRKIISSTLQDTLTKATVSSRSLHRYDFVSSLPFFHPLETFLLFFFPAE